MAGYTDQLGDPHMKTRNKLLLPLVLLGAANIAAAQDVGTSLPVIELEDFTQTPARSFDDFVGRAVLIEFFAYW